MRSQDAWGRERWARSDDWGRLVEVVEPDAASNGSVTAAGNMVTQYAYDAVDQLTQITQGSQTRAFKYDSLGRMTRQKLAEQTATINDSGVYVGAGGGGALWSDSFSYDDRSNLTQRIDARGVKTNFDYLLSGSPDPLNRLRGKTSADTTHGTIHEAADITYAYMTTGDQERIYTASSAGVSTETYAYDVEGRVSDYTMSMTSRSSYPMQTSYLYDTANRLTEVRYPASYGMSGNPRKTVNVVYDQTSRLSSLTVGGVAQMDQIAYNDYGQATSIRIGGGSANPLNEEYSFDANTGLMTNQKVKRGATSLMDLTYEYNRGSSNGSINGTTGNLTHIVNNLDRNKDRVYEYDTLGRLIKSKGGAATGVGGVTANWTQDYAYDRYGNKTATTKSGITANSAAIPLDGLASQTYTAATNRITNLSHEYDNSGNMTRGAAPDGTLQRFEFDEAGRIKVIKTDAGTAIETNTYATSRERLIKETSTDRTYYAWGGSSVLAEFTEAIASSTPSWAKSYIYAGSRLLSTITKNGSAELTEYHHPDRLGTKAVSDTTANTFKEQATLPFGVMIDAETAASTNQKFTSYDRSGASGLDYAVNRTYNSGQSRFTQVDPIGMASASIGNPQSMNLFAYTQNNPVDFVDPSGLLLAAPAQYSCTTTRVWGHWEDGNGNITGYASFSKTVCQGGGGGSGEPGGGSGGKQSDKDKVKKQLEDFLKFKTVACANALKALKVSDKQLLNAFNKNTFLTGGSSPTSANTNYSRTETETFKTRNGRRVTGTTKRVYGPWVTTTTTKNGVQDFLGQTNGFLIHELSHAALRRNDVSLYGRLKDAQDKGKISGLDVLSNVNRNSASNAISDFLNKACNDTTTDAPLPSSDDQNSANG